MQMAMDVIFVTFKSDCVLLNTHYSTRFHLRSIFMPADIFPKRSGGKSFFMFNNSDKGV